MRDLKRALVICFTTAVMLGSAISLYIAVHSSLFLVQVVEVADQPENAPVDAQTITQLAAVPTGEANLFELDLKEVENRILANQWIREVRLQKRFPQTLSVAVIFREPKALFQGPDGVLSYIDFDGKPFGRLNLQFISDLPLLSGFSTDLQDQSKIKNALQILNSWEESSLNSVAELSTLSWDSQYGYRALISYSLGKSQSHVRVTVDLGQEVDADSASQLQRLSRVIHYLSLHSMNVRQIFADVGKKIVVKTSRGS